MVVVWGMGALGLITGALISLSTTPIAASVLPLLFSIAGAAAGLFIGKIDISDEKNKSKIDLVGYCLLFLCGSCLISIPIGVFIKHRYYANLAYEHNLDVSSDSNVIESIILRSKLKALGASEKEIRSAIGSKQKIDESKIDSTLRLLSSKNEKQSEVPLIAFQPPLKDMLKGKQNDF